MACVRHDVSNFERVCSVGMGERAQRTVVFYDSHHWTRFCYSPLLVIQYPCCSIRFNRFTLPALA